jgi:hypothetical protein
VKGCARSLFFQLVQFLAAVGAVMAFFQFRHGLPPGKTLGASLFAGVFGWIGLTLLFGILQPLRERSALRDCLAGKRPRDGTRVGIAGTIAATGEPLRAPMTGADCVAYKYEIFQIVGSGKQRMHHRYFEGIALVPSVIATPAGTFRLLAVPAFDFGTDSVRPERALAHWNEHVKSARFEPPSSNRTLEKQWTDDDGAYRCEKDHTGGKPVPLTESTFQEDLVRGGDRVYAVGLFSESRGGLVPHANWAKETRIMKGDPESVLRQLESRIVRYLVGGILSLAAAAGIVIAFLSNVRR